MRAFHFILPLSALLALAAPCAQAGFPLEVDDAEVNAPGEYEWTLGLENSREPTARLRSAEVELATGLTDGLEGSFGVGYGWLRDLEQSPPVSSRGILDYTVELMAPLLEASDGAPFDFSLKAASVLPASGVENAIGNQYTDLSLLAIATREWGDLALDVNAGLKFSALDHRTERDGDAWIVGGALRWQAQARIALLIESYWQLPADDRSQSEGLVNAGVQADLVPHVQLAASVGTGFGAESPETEARLGLVLLY